MIVNVYCKLCDVNSIDPSSLVFISELPGYPSRWHIQWSRYVTVESLRHSWISSRSNKHNWPEYFTRAMPGYAQAWNRLCLFSVIHTFSFWCLQYAKLAWSILMMSLPNLKVLFWADKCSVYIYNDRTCRWLGHLQLHWFKFGCSNEAVTLVMMSLSLCRQRKGGIPDNNQPEGFSCIVYPNTKFRTLQTTAHC